MARATTPWLYDRAHVTAIHSRIPLMQDSGVVHPCEEHISASSWIKLDGNWLSLVFRLSKNRIVGARHSGGSLQ
jgi:hypothetical protein